MGLFSGKCSSTARLDGKTAIVTGSNTGIGKETVKDFYKRGARVILACRNLNKGKEAAEDIQKQCATLKNLGELVVSNLDLSSLKSVRQFAQEILEEENRIDLLINNAGIMMCPQGETEDGFETQMGTNHFGHFLLTLLLLPKIIENTPSRIVNVSSMAHKAGEIDFDDINWKKRTYSPLKAYGQSKLANVLFTKELARKITEANIEGVTVYSLHPGVVNTELTRHFSSTYFAGLEWVYRNILGIFMKTPEQGAQTTIYCAVDEKCSNETGLYYSDCAVAKASDNANKDEDAERLWELSLVSVGLDKNYNPFKKLNSE